MIKITSITNKKAAHVANLYDLSADIYNRRYKKIQEEKIKIVTKYRSNLRSKLVLDCGCGSGLLLPFLDKKTRYFGIDTSHEMLKQCPKKNNMIRSDVTNLPFFDDTFDEVFCITVLQNIDNNNQALCELKRVLKNKGRLFISILRKRYNKDDLSPLSELKMIKTIDDEKIEDIMFIFEKNA